MQRIFSPSLLDTAITNAFYQVGLDVKAIVRHYSKNENNYPSLVNRVVVTTHCDQAYEYKPYDSPWFELLPPVLSETPMFADSAF